MKVLLNKWKTDSFYK